MDYTLVNVITFVIGITFLVNGYRMVKTGREDILMFVMSGVIGLGLIVVALFPDLSEVIASLLGIKFKTNAILIVANLTLFVLLTYLFNRIGRLNSDISRLNEELSLLRNRLDEFDGD